MSTPASKKRHSLQRLVIEPTYACNLRCKHCYVLRSARAVNRVGHLADIRPVSFWKAVLKNAPADISVHFTGGEIFTYPKIFELLETTARRYPFSLVTNGSILDKADCQRLAQLSPRHVTISIHGNEQVHDRVTGVVGSYRKTVDAIETLIGLLPRDCLSINFVLLPENYRVVSHVVEFLEGMGVHTMVIQLFDPALHRCGITAGIEQLPPPQPLDWSNVDFRDVQELFEKVNQRTDHKLSVLLPSQMTPGEIVDFLLGNFNMDKWECSEVFDTMRCSPTGKVYTCSGLEIGNLGQQTILDLWDSDQYTSFRQSHTSAALKPGCEGCCKVRRKE